MALPSGESKQARADRLRKPVRVPGKRGARRRIAQVRNGVRRVRRVRHKVAGRAAQATNWIGGTFLCKVCGAEVPYRRADAHNFLHAQAKEKEWLAKQAKKADPAAPPLPREPSKTKQQGQFDKNKIDKQTDANGKKIKKVDKRRRYRRETDGIGDDMAGRTRRPGTNGTPSSQHAAAVLAAITAWAEYDPPTVADLRAHLLSMDAALGGAAAPLNGFAGRLVQRKFHPVVAQPIDQAAEAIAGIRHYFTEAYARFERVYADRLSYERNQDAAAKPDDSLFDDVG